MNSNGQQISNPPLAINLHYLVTAYGANPFDPEILLGFAMQVFHNTPVIPRSVIQTALTALDSGTPTNEQQLVSTSTLASQIDQIRITPEALSTEEIYRLWTAFQVSYRPTTSYQVSVVVIQKTQSYQSNMPVQFRSLVAMPLTGPIISSVSPLMAAPGQIMTIQGSNFLAGGTAANTTVSFDEGTPVPAATVQGNVVRVVVPSTLSAGTCNVRVMCSVTFPPGTTSHPSFSSNAVPFQLIPVITVPAAPPGTPAYTVAEGAALTITLTPPVATMQTVAVYIADQAIQQPPQVPLPATPTTSNTVTVTVPPTFATGAYPLRVQVDGAQSQLTEDTNPLSPTFGQWLPQVQVTI
jgi:hypothetical protein